MYPEGGRILLGVSGGPDSLAMLLLAHAGMPGRIGAATVDHGLRRASVREAQMVADLCESIAVEHFIIPIKVATGNLQLEARRGRYRGLGATAIQNGYDAVATAHQADDQAETFMMRLNRASGVRGLSGVRERRTVPGFELPLIRPLLGWRRAELQRVLDNAGWAAVDDPSNRDDRFDRVRMRKHLADAPWLDVPAIAQSAGHLTDADEALQWMANCEWREQVDELTDGYLYRPRAPKAVRLRVLAKAIDLLGGQPRGQVLARMDAALTRGGKANCGGVIGEAGLRGWKLTTEPKRGDRPASPPQ